jgi:hypothetical protein
MNTNFSQVERELGVSFILKDKGLERLDDNAKGPKEDGKNAKDGDKTGIDKDKAKKEECKTHLVNSVSESSSIQPS